MQKKITDKKIYRIDTPIAQNSVIHIFGGLSLSLPFLFLLWQRENDNAQAKKKNEIKEIINSTTKNG